MKKFLIFLMCLISIEVFSQTKEVGGFAGNTDITDTMNLNYYLELVGINIGSGGTSTTYDSTYIHERVDSTKLSIDSLRNEIETISVTGNSVQRMAFIVGVTENAPEDGDSTVTHGEFNGKHIEVYTSTGNSGVGLLKLYNKRPVGFTISDSTITVNPSFVDEQTVIIEATASSFWSNLTLREPAPSGPDAQNLILYSEQINNAYWTLTGCTATPNQANDLNGQPTLESVSSAGELNIYAYVENIAPSTAHVLSFEINANDGSLNSAAQVQIYDEDYTSITPTGTYTVTGSVTRLNFTFTTAPGTSALRLYIMKGAWNDQINIGRVHIYEGTVGSKSYATTTTSQVN